MRTLAVTALASALTILAVPAIAGRDEVLVKQVERTMAAKRVAQMELAKQQQGGPQQSGLAGPSGQPGKVGPTTTQPRWSGSRAGRPTAADHP